MSKPIAEYQESVAAVLTKASAKKGAIGAMAVSLGTSLQADLQAEGLEAAIADNETVHKALEQMIKNLDSVLDQPTEGRVNAILDAGEIILASAPRGFFPLTGDNYIVFEDADFDSGVRHSDSVFTELCSHEAFLPVGPGTLQGQWGEAGIPVTYRRDGEVFKGTLVDGQKNLGGLVTVDFQNAGPYGQGRYGVNVIHLTADHI